MVWRSLFGCLEGAPLADYGEFEATHFTEIMAWRNYYAPDYADVFGGAPRVVDQSSTRAFAHYGGSQMTSLKVLFQAIFHPFQVHLLLVW
jgi:hypothetical protein